MSLAGPWRHAAGIVRAHPWSFFASGGFYVGFFALTLAPGLINRAIFDSLSGRGPAGVNVWTLIALVVGLAYGRFGLLYGGGVLFNVFRYRGEALLKLNIMDWLVSAPGPRTLPGSPGEAVSRFRDDTLETVGVATIMIVSPQVLTGLIAFAIMLHVDAVITLVVALPMLAAVALTYLLTRQIQGYRKAAREATAAVTSFIGETFSAVQSIKLAGAEGRVVNRMNTLNSRRRAASIRDLMFGAALNAIYANMAAVATGCVLLLAAGAMRRGSFTVGDFSLFASYLALVTAAPGLVGQILAQARQSAVSLARMRELTPDAPPLQLVARPSRRPQTIVTALDEALRTLSVRGLTASHGADRGVADASFEIDRGAFVVVTGKVGAGKTTLLRALLGLTPLDAGEILWNGRPIDDPATFMIPPRCAYTGQVPRLFSETVGDNIRMGEAALPDALASAVALAVFDQDLAGFERGLDTVVGSRGVTLSGGQRQRAAAARMFLRDPDLLIFDDISSALDVATEQALWRGLFADGRRTCLAVSHRREAFRRADQILLLDEGRIVGQGDADALRGASALFRSIWEDEGD